MRSRTRTILVRGVAACASIPFLLTAISAQTYTIQTFAGGAVPANVLGPAASLSNVSAVAADPTGNVYLALEGSPAVLKLGASGLLTRFAGTGIPGFSGDTGLAVNAQLSIVRGLATDSAGNVYISDGSRVRKVVQGIINTIAGTGVPGYGGDLGVAQSAQLNNPQGIAIDGAGKVYIADTGNHRVRKITGAIITTLAGNGTPGFTGDGANPVNAQLDFPSDVLVDSTGAVYISDTGNNRIRKIVSGVINTIVGGGINGLGDGGTAIAAQLATPQGIAVDAFGNLYIADTQHHRLRAVSGGLIRTVAGTGTPGFSGDGNVGTNASLNSPRWVAVDASGDIYIADELNSRVRRVLGGTITTIAGGGSPGDGGPSLNAQIYTALELAMDPQNNLYIADTNDHRIREISAGVINTVAGNGLYGLNGDGGPATSATLNYPGGVRVDGTGDIFIADTANCVVRKVVQGQISTVAGNGTCGYSGDNGPALAAQLMPPTSVAVDASGNIYIADPSTNVVRKVSTSGMITNFAGTPGIVGQAGDGGPATGALLNAPQNVAVAPDGSVYISDTGNSRIRKVTAGVITPVAGNGVASFGGDGGEAILAQIHSPLQMGFDPLDNLYFVDSANYRIRKVSGGVISTIAGTGIQGYSGDNGPALSASLFSPAGLTVDQNGVVYVSDTSINTVRVLIPAANGCSFSLSSSAINVGVAGGIFAVNVTGGPGCQWSVFNLPSWISVSGPSSGSTSGPVTLAIAPNSGFGRSATIFIAGLAVTVTQDSALACVYTLSAGAEGFPGAGGVGVVNVTTTSGCTWTALSTVPWATISAGGSGSGSGSLAIQVAANPGVARTGIITIAGLSFAVDQAAASTSAFTNAGAFAQMSSGAGWKTTFSFVNVGTTVAQIRLNLFDDNGNPALVPLNFPQNTASIGVELAATIDRTIQPGALLLVEVVIPASQQNLEGWAQLLYNGDVNGSATFRYTAGTTDHQAYVPLETRNSPAYVLPYDNTNGFVAGVALANVGPAGNSVGLTIRDDTGAILTTTVIPIPVNSHTSFVLPTNYPQTAGKRGTIELDASGGSTVAALGIQFNTTSFGFSTIPALSKP